MPSGKKSKQQRRAASGSSTPPPVRSKGGGSRPSGGSRRLWLIIAVVVLVLVGLGVGLDLALGSSGGGGSGGGSGTQTVSISTLKNVKPAPPLGPAGPEGPPIESGPSIAPAGSLKPGQSVDGIQCNGSEQVAFHHHARLTIFVNGQSKSVPYGVGIADAQLLPGIGVPFVDNGACFSWLHTHAADGIIHIESPVTRTFTLGDFFDVWGQPLSPTQVGPAKGKVTALYDGAVWTGNPRDIPLDEHSQIQLDVGEPLVGPVQITNWGNL
jgi:hypothetical protein